MADEILIGDSAYPPAVYPTAWNGKPISGWCVYAGGNTPHVWPDAEIARLMAQPWCRYIVPIFTRSNPPTGSAAISQAMLDAGEMVDWALVHKQPSGTLFMVDAETAVNSIYFETVNQTLLSKIHLKEIIYGSKSTVTKNARPSGGYDEASWTFQDTVPDDTASQFASYALYDVNRFASKAPLWDLHPPKATTVRFNLSQEDAMLSIESRTLHPAEYNAIIPTGVGTVVLGAHGGAAGAATVKVTLWNNDEPQEPLLITVGGPAPHHVVAHNLNGADMATFERVDTEAYPVAAGFRP